MQPLRPRRLSAGHLLSIGSVSLLFVAVAAGLFVPGCREQSSAPIDRNKAPETVLTGVPGDSTTNFYWLHLYWSGYDHDGTVVGYEWAITDSLPPAEAIVWKYTEKTDSTFIFTVEESREVLGHRFYLRAVDNEGKRDPVPAFTFFTVRNNCNPSVWFTRAEAVSPDGEVMVLSDSTNPLSPRDTVPAGWGVRFAWSGSDCDRAVLPGGDTMTVGRIVGYDYKLVPVEQNAVVVGELDTEVSYQPERLRSDLFEMRVRSRDDAGLASTDPAVRHFVWNRDPETRFCRELLPGGTDSVKVFYATTGEDSAQSYTPYVHGDTLRLTSDGVLLHACVQAVDPDPPHEIVSVQARLVKDAAFWIDLEPDRIFRVQQRQYTGDYYLMARSLDRRDRWDGTPDTIVFHVNRAPRFLDTWIDYTNFPAEIHRAQRPAAGRTYPVPRRLVGGEAVPADTLRGRFGAYDPDFAWPTQFTIELNYRFERYPTAGGPREELFLRPLWVKGAAPNPQNPSWPMDPDTMAVTFSMQVLGSTALTLASGEPFREGDYVLYVEIREAYQSDADRYGYRHNVRRVPFRLTW